jgi:hypothetical protein
MGYALTRLFTAIGLLLALCIPTRSQQTTLASLIPAAPIIVVARITKADYSRTSSDGPMIAQAKVLSVIKGNLKKEQSFRFTETAWVGPAYQTGEIRVLFIESAGPNSWRILSNLYAKTDFFIERDAAPLLNLDSLTSFLGKVPAPAERRILISSEMLR